MPGSVLDTGEYQGDLCGAENGRTSVRNDTSLGLSLKTEGWSMLMVSYHSKMDSPFQCKGIT